ncbi:MAG: hypothetical protein ACM3X6_07485 [Patescibacteria group bacterium]
MATDHMLEGDAAYPAATCEVEAGFAAGIKKRFRVTVPLYR